VALKPGVVKFLYPGVLHPGVKNSLTTRDLRSRAVKFLYPGVLDPGVQNSLTTRGLRSRSCKNLISWGLTSRV